MASTALVRFDDAPALPAPASAPSASSAPLSELVMPDDLGGALKQGFVPVKPMYGSETPPPLVGATLSCLEVPLQARGLRAGDERKADQVALVNDSGPQYGLFLFGGDDQENKQTDTLLIYYLQEQKWRKPAAKGRPPSKRSRHTATVVYNAANQSSRLVIFGGVGATNAVSLLDPASVEWTHPASRSKPGEKEKARRRARKTGSDENISETLLPCARFGHTAAAVDERLFVFGGADFKGPLGDLYELDLAAEPIEWCRPEPSGFPPPPSAKHASAVVRDHMLIMSGESAWGGHLWALRLRPSLHWVRSTLPDFPLLGASRFGVLPYTTPRPHKRDEVLIFGGHLEATGGQESEVLDVFFTLDLRSWRGGEAEIPRETWGDVEKRLLAKELNEQDMKKARDDWEDEQKKKQKEILKAQRRKNRMEKLRGLRGDKPDGADKKDTAGKGEGAEEDALAEDEDLSDEEALAAKEAEKEFELPPETMPTLTFGSWVPLRIGRNLPPPRFGHAMAMAGTVAYVFGGRNRARNEPVMSDLYSFDGGPLVWKAVSYDGDGPGTRVSHCMIQLHHHLYVLGGGSGNRSFNDLHRLDLYTMHWELVHTRGAAPGAKPEALIGHSMAWVDPYLVVFAGGDGRRPSNELHTLELATATWHHISTSGAPPAPRVGHSSTLIDAELYVIGGFSRGKYFHDVHALHVETLQWTQVVTSGTPPHGRVSHTATLHDGAVHLFGGSAGGACFNDYLVLTPAAPNAPPPAKKGKNAMVAQSSGAGTSEALVPKASGRRLATWSAPEVAGFAPEPRYSHCATVIGSMLFIVGGLARKGRPYDDVHVLDLGALVWSMPRLTHEGPAPRGRHTVAAVGSVLFLFGGGAQGELYDDIWTLDVDGKGMGRLMHAATQDAMAHDRARADGEVIPMDFLAPHFGEGGAPEEYPAELEYEDFEARAANANEVRSWLTHLGLAQHAYTFEAHEIDFEVLLQLQEHDLIDMRVDDPMQRMRLLSGIDVLRARGSLVAAGVAPKERLFRDRYRLGAEVNFGGHPAVLAVDCKTDLKVVLKFVPDMVEYHRQVSLHKELRGEPIARMADSYAAVRMEQLAPGEKEGALQRGWGLPCLVLEYGECSLADYMTRGLMPAAELKATFEAMLRVVLTLHAHGYAHCALQPESFRLYGGTGWRLATLDSLTRFGQPTSTKCPVCYAAPEVVRYLRRPAGVAAGTPVKTAPASEAQDVWSLGLLLWQLFSQQPLVGSEAEALTMLPSMRSVEPSLGCVTDAQARHLLQKMLQQDESERITPQKILKHGYLTGGLDTVQLESTFGPMQKGQLFVRSLLQAVAEGLGEKRPKARHAR